VTIPAEYRNQLVTELVEGAKEKRVAIPAAYDQVPKTEKIADSRVEWRPVLCETNTSPGVIRRLQSALQGAGYDPGRVDGRLGPDTMAAVRSYQQDKNLSTGGLTIETMDSLGVAL
jgi:peptidoglycan hydrolase-like protein with peptidoglycan-binding domain